MVVQIVDFSSEGKNSLNPLSLKLRRAIWTALDSAENDERVTSVILTGGSKNFSAGADLTEFGKIQLAASNGNKEGMLSLIDVVNRIENFPKPVIAAIAGNALGGGLEVALSCHYRIADRNAKFGLPEVNVGVIPGAGGTQRLPRLVGVAKSLEMILSGKAIGSKEALELGLVDHVESTSDSLLQAAKSWAEWAELMPLDDRRVGKMKIRESSDEFDMIIQFASKKLPSPEMGGQGVWAALKAVKECRRPIEEGIEVEGSHFLQALSSSQGCSRRHAFFAVRKAQKPVGKAPKGHPLLSASPESKTAAVIGAGLMGSGIAMVLVQAGFQVYLVDVSKTSLEKGEGFLRGTITSYVQRGKFSARQGAIFQAAIKTTQKLDDLSSCKLVVEAVIENMGIKKKIFQSLDRISPPNAVLVSNTSTLSIDEMASALSPSRRQLFAGWHFFSPAHVMKLVEIVVGKETSNSTVSLLQYLTKRIGKIGVVVGNCDGFVGNRLLVPYGAETTLLLEEGVATVESIDKAFVKFGLALGPFQMGDLAGLDVAYNIRKERGWVRVGNGPGKNRPERYPDVGDDLVTKLKRLGQKTGKGWYDYDKNIGRGRKPIPSKEVAEFVRRYVMSPQKPFTDTEIIERVLFPLVNEGFRCLEEGIAQQPSDIDVVYLYGYGWPIYRGGPMYWADHEVGLNRLLKTLMHFSRQFPTTNYYVPSKLLQTCVALNMTVEQYYETGMHRRNISKL